ncbi:agarase [Pseudomaricurvus alcaniphilus]|uniref:beta-galactosidase n=1 Tax=Pseudomaricurvus alcaniphilus TaxID=1166482 RepID=UPI00140892B6|nr:beta-galactosidase [Pseudomaricurvus alcaniphilus]NHN39748.1 agarase [Pseudomaricurvus alcaniphilus]
MQNINLNRLSKFALTLALVTPTLALVACNSADPNHVTAPDDAATIRTLYDFEADKLPADVQLVAASGSLTASDASTGQQALNLKMHSAEHSYSGVTFRPEQPWYWGDYKDFSLAFDIANRGEVSAQLYLDVEDIDGAVTTRSISIPVGAAKTYYSKMRGHDLRSPDGNSNVELNFSSGLRSNPATWEGDGVQFVSMWGKKNLNLNGIRRISLSVQGTLRDKEITLDNVRLIANPKMDRAFLKGIVDQYGQSAKTEFEGKIHSDAELIAQRDAELAELQGGEPMADRSRFSGWKNGPKLKATGYFRTEKVNGKWSLVDPEGYLYFATGLDIIRLSNSTTMTGYDFNQQLIEQRKAGDLTPEDSMGLNTVPARALPSRQKVSSIRADMFQWLPSYSDPLGNHFGYRRSAHSGPLKHGETFSFYSANLERKYGETSPHSYLDQWEKVTVERMLNWGFTSLGNWTDPRFYDQQRVPYFANGWIIGDFKTVSSGNDFWAPMPDVFDPVFEERAMATAKTVADEVQGSPWCVGVFIDNEKSFGRSETNESRLGIVLHTLRRDGKDVPTKRAFTELMRKQYSSIEALNAAWNKTIASWEAFDAGIDSTLQTEAQLADYSQLLGAYADQYFATVNKALKRYMPNHLYLGARFPDWGMPKEVVKASAKHVDVISYNSYKEGLPNHKWEFLAELDMPSIIGEFHIGANDTGLFHPGLIHAANQQDRARMYQEYMQSVIDNPYFVGAHWFQYMDSPITGRAYDGENYNVGFVNVADVPYKQMVEAARSLHDSMYRRRYGN